MKQQKEFDAMNELFAEKICELVEDMEWQCKRANLQHYDFTAIVSMGCVWAGALALANGTAKDGDEKFVSAFRKMLQQAREQVVKANEDEFIHH